MCCFEYPEGERKVAEYETLIGRDAVQRRMDLLEMRRPMPLLMMAFEESIELIRGWQG